MQAIADDTTKSEEKRFEAKQQILKNELDNINNQIADEKKLYDQGVINYQAYLTAINNLDAQAAGVQANISNNQKNFVPKFDLGNSIIKSLGLDPENAATKAFFTDLSSAVSSAYDEITKNIEDKAQRQVNAIQQVIDALDNQISEQQNVVDEQKKLSDEGLANDLTNQQAKLDDLQAKKAAEITAREEAQRKLEEIHKEEALIQAASLIASQAQSTVNLIEAGTEMTKATAKTMDAHAGIPFVGIVIALGLIATMVAAFFSLKAAFTKPDAAPKLRKGGAIDLQGPSHEEGGIGVYNKKTGKEIAEVEGGEFLFTVNKRSRQKHLSLLNAINDDDEELIHEIIYKRNDDVTGAHVLRVEVSEAVFEKMHALKNMFQDKVDALEGLRKVVRDAPKPPMEEIAAVNKTAREVQEIIIKNGLQKADLNRLDNLKHLEKIAQNTKKEDKAEVTDYGDYIIIKEKGRIRKIWKKK